ncbi:hypothetical protein F5H01DRAFT_583 [Linnemannia elongata]|nr:hypothetical protein F5H01DRAFT_583 [Linnemannia elongata]
MLFAVYPPMVGDGAFLHGWYYNYTKKTRIAHQLDALLLPLPFSFFSIDYLLKRVPRPVFHVCSHMPHPFMVDGYIFACGFSFLLFPSFLSLPFPSLPFPFFAFPFIFFFSFSFSYFIFCFSFPPFFSSLFPFPFPFPRPLCTHHLSLVHPHHRSHHITPHKLAFYLFLVPFHWTTHPYPSSFFPLLCSESYAEEPLTTKQPNPACV